jgi:hypothetical protein
MAGRSTLERSNRLHAPGASACLDVRRSGVRRTALLTLIVWCCSLAVGWAQSKDPLARARALYNQGQFEAAVAAAEEGRRQPARADSADLIAARSYLERYRASVASDDLTNARDRLRRLNTQRLDQSERVEFVIGLGEMLFFDGSPGAAAAVFGSVLEGPDLLVADGRERLLDWWATALEADARRRTDGERRAVYQQIRERMQTELALNPSSGVASYWLASAARGQGDLLGAWDAAQAGWVRAPLASDRGAVLRGDLDRLVQRAIIPERARTSAQSADELSAEWARFKERWSK